VSREQPNMEKIINSIQDQTIRYSISKELFENLKRIATEPTGALEYLDSEPVFHVRMNTIDADMDRGIAILEQNNISSKIIEGTGSIEIGNTGEMVRKILPENNFYFQNTGSFAVCAVAASFKAKKILDCCAAPGTKSLTLSLILPDVDITASDINSKRLRLIIPFLNSSGRSKVSLASGDITSVPFKNIFDTILIDAPCTSSGTLRKNPDLKNKIGQENILNNSNRQKNILQAVMDWTKPGSTIIYAVCSFIEDETEQVLNDSLRNSGENDFKILEIEHILSKYGYNMKKGRYGVFLLPHHKLNNDLFYISAIAKK